MPIGTEEKFSWVTSYLLIGAEPVEGELPELARQGVGAILNVKGSVGLREEATRLGLEYAHIPIQNAGAPDYLVLVRCCRFVDEQRKVRRPVLAHCALGIGRSATVAIAYLLFDGYSLDEALQCVRSGRPAIDPSARQLIAAVEFARDTQRSDVR